MSDRELNSENVIAALQEGCRLIAAEFDHPDNAFMPTLFGYSRNAKVSMAELDMDDPELVATTVIPEFARRCQARLLATVIEGHAGSVAKEDGVYRDEGDILVIHVVSLRGGRVVTCPIIRDGLHPPRLGEWSDLNAVQGGFSEPMIHALSYVVSMN